MKRLLLTFVFVLPLSGCGALLGAAGGVGGFSAGASLDRAIASAIDHDMRERRTDATVSVTPDRARADRSTICRPTDGSDRQYLAYTPRASRRLCERHHERCRCAGD